MPSRALELAAELATRPGFDCLFDPNPATPEIEPYYDPAGYPTQGYGRLLSRTPWAPLSQWQPVSKAQAWADLLEDAARAERSVARLCPVPLEDHQRAALIDFAFNAGAGNLQVSALRQAVLRGDTEAVAQQFGRWVYSRGIKMRGLVRRRAAEAALYVG